jgi:hypothetical protein
VTVSPSVLLISIAIGVPLMLLAMGVLYHAYILSKQPLDLDAHVEQLATDPTEVMRGLQRSMNDIRGELTRQRASLREMLSDAQPAVAARETSAPAASTPTSIMTSTAPVAPAPAPAPMHAMPAMPIDRTSGELRAAVRDLAAEGLSDRSIARRLRIGLEEVRLARATSGVRGSRRQA